MRAAAHDPAFARKLGIPQSVAREFVREDTMPQHTSSERAKRMASAAAVKPKRKPKPKQTRNQLDILAGK